MTILFYFFKKKRERQRQTATEREREKGGKKEEENPMTYRMTAFSPKSGMVMTEQAAPNNVIKTLMSLRVFMTKSDAVPRSRHKTRGLSTSFRRKTAVTD